MKHSIQFLFFTWFFCLNACHDTMDINPCLDDKIKDFKKASYAQSIVRIDKPGETLYWFINSTVDGGEAVLNEKCELICITDCECAGNFVECDGTQFDYPMTTIWEK